MASICLGLNVLRLRLSHVVWLNCVYNSTHFGKMGEFSLGQLQLGQSCFGLRGYSTGNYTNYIIIWLGLLYCRTKPGVVIILELQYIPRNMHTVFALLCFVVVIHWLIIPYPSGVLHWHCGKPAKQPWWIWINNSSEFIMNDCVTTTKQSTTKPYAYFLGYTVFACR